MTLREDITGICTRARDAAQILRSLSPAVKNAALFNAAQGLRAAGPELKAANERDLEAGRAKGLSSAMLDRLELTGTRIEAMATGLETVAALPDPVGDIVRQTVHPNGMRIAQIRQPLGVVAIIYESRPNVTADAAALCLKSGNAAILRGGKEAIHANRAIAAVVPRGGKGLISRILEESRIPVVAHLDGVCHVYVDADADPVMAKSIVLNAKLQRPGVCNALETLLVHEDIAGEFLPDAAQALEMGGCELRGCPKTRRIISCKEATDEDWTTEYLDRILSIKVVESLDAAIDHINRYGSHHSDSIVTERYDAAERFLDEVDSAAVYVNASTRFTDGFEFGLGAEIGISTNKLHCRGPMALQELTCLKYIIRGSGQIRE
ncbi:MAG: Gamma-glutamyl phosphate reductase [Verrucomicrobia bacterium ADurb.Bin345]|nr:MAG: Gamma-glutamyl phosphate reductase [Verrucomicrobia bacterium ADurb.Bin345]